MFDSSSKAQPNACEAEKSILSSMLQEPSPYIDRALEDGLTPEMFYLPAHQTLFRVMVEKDRNIELLSLTQHLADCGQLENIGGPAELTSIFTFVPTAAHFDHHLGIVKNKHTLRYLIAACTGSIGEACQSRDDGTMLMSRLISDLEAHLAHRDTSGRRKTKVLKECLPTVIDNIEARINGEAHEWLPLPWPSVRFVRGGAAFVGARPGKGKSAFLLNAVEHLAIHVGEPTCLISLEMSSAQLIERTLACQSGVHTTSRTNFDRRELSAIKITAERIIKAPLFISDMPGATADEIIVEMRRVQRIHRVNVFAIDYIQDIGPASNEEAHRDKLRIDNALSKFDVARKKLDMTHIFAAQLDRAADKTPVKEMTMGLLADTSRLEKIAYQILLLGDRPDGDPKASPWEMMAKVAKNRCGPTGCFPMKFDPKLTKWTEGE